MTDTLTKFAVLTPPGAAAIATIAVFGPQAWEIVRRSFRPAAAIALPPAPDFHRYFFGQFGGPPGDAVVVAARPAVAGECVEIHCHGGLEVVSLVAAELTRAGAMASGPNDLLPTIGETTLHATAQMELTHAPTLRTAAILLDQCNGAFGRVLAGIDAALDASDLIMARDLIAKVTRYASLGRHLIQPWRVAVVGAPNVGKSSLVNALAGYQRTVVTEVPGTTRDAVVTALAIDGWPVELIDTAGQHSAGDSLEEQGIARGRSAAAAADLCLWVVDGTAKPVWPKTDSDNPLLVINKSDLPAVWNVASVADGIIISARTGDGLGHLCQRISRRLVPDPPRPGMAVPFAADQADQLPLLAKAVAASDIRTARAALQALGHPMQTARPD
jgi:tRNA modification GTPase